MSSLRTWVCHCLNMLDPLSVGTPDLTPADIALQKVADALVALVREKDSPIHGENGFSVC